jgi:glutamate racemase
LNEISEIRHITSERIVTKTGEATKITHPKRSAPIGMFDSGVGGLTVLSEIARQLPHEDVIYFGDTARIPYGGRPQKEIISINREIIDYLIGLGAKMIVLACGTSSSIAYPVIKDEYTIPIVGLVGPGSEAAVRATRNGRIGLIATMGTVDSGAFQAELEKLRPGVEVVAVGCPLFVPLIEGGFADGEEIKRAAAEYLRVMIDRKVDTLILGCTHYPHLRNMIAEIMGPDVTLVDPAEETVRETSRILRAKAIETDSPAHPTYTYMVSQSPEGFKELGSRLFGKPIGKVSLVSLIAKKRHI